MKKYKIVIITTIILFALSACNDWLDVNTDPNYPSELANYQATIPTAQLALTNAIMGWDMGFAGGYWSQYWAQSYTTSQFKTIENYSNQEFDFAYDNIFSTALTDLKTLLVNNEKDDAWYMIAEVLSVYAWQISTDTWGDIPYSEALRGDEYLFNPKFDKQQDIYTDLLTRINQVLADDYSEASIPEGEKKYDFIYGGDMKLWMEFAYSLKLKVMLRLSETPEYDNAALLTFITGNTFLSEPAQIPGSYWEGTTGKSHPMSEYEDENANYISGNVIASRTLLSYLNENKDPRLEKLYNAPSNGTQEGAFQGDYDSKEDSDGDGTKDDKEEYSTVSFTKDAEFPLMSLWEVNFYIAEVYARANDFVKAKTYYNKAVEAAMDYWELNDTSITTTGGYAEFTATTAEMGVEQIAMQKWVANCKTQHIEAFLERNRTKYPKVNKIDIKKDRTKANINFPVGNFTISVKGRDRLNETLPSSPIYPNDVISRNSEADPQKVDIGEDVWWNMKAENFVE